MFFLCFFLLFFSSDFSDFFLIFLCFNRIILPLLNTTPPKAVEQFLEGSPELPAKNLKAPILEVLNEVVDEL